MKLRYLIPIIIILPILLIMSFFVNKTDNYYIKGPNSIIDLYSDDLKIQRNINRGVKVTVSNKVIRKNNDSYRRINYDGQKYLINNSNLTKYYKECLDIKEAFIRTPVTVYEYLDTSKIISYIPKGELVTIVDFDYINSEGLVNKLKIKYNEIEGYVYGKYLVNTREDALKNYKDDSIYQVHLQRGNTQGGGSAGNLDYFPNLKPSFENNSMPNEVRSLYLNANVIDKVDDYIELAKQTNINAFVVDVKDNTVPGYKSEIMKIYSKTNYNKAVNSVEDYKEAIKKLKDNGYYVIGRITVFKDNYYAMDHPEDSIIDKETNKPFNHNNSYWPSAYKRSVWEYNVELAKEAVELMGFNEIQFDYVRFPDRTNFLIESNLDFRNEYNEEKAQAIQNFLFYACDQIHEKEAYVSADVFGESAHNYVSGYGQYWAAISNVVDVISGMPYPDHFNKYQYNFSIPVWTRPYELITYWAKNYVLKQQSLIETPAIVRTWIQAYDVIKNPKTIYDTDMVLKQIKALKDSGLDGGYITWNSGSNITKYRQILNAFK